MDFFLNPLITVEVLYVPPGRNILTPAAIDSHLYDSLLHLWLTTWVSQVETEGLIGQFGI